MDNFQVPEKYGQKEGVEVSKGSEPAHAKHFTTRKLFYQTCQILTLSSDSERSILLEIQSSTVDS